MNTEQPKDIVSITAGDNRPQNQIESLLDDGGSTRFMRMTLLGITLLVLVFIAWSVMAKVDELARARGEIQPVGHVQSLQSEMGGSIAEVFVKEGDKVTAGQELVEFTASNLLKDLEQTETKINSLAIDRERMLAMLEDRQPDFSPYAKDYPLLVEQAEISFRTQLAGRTATIKAKQQELQEQRSLLEGAERDKKLIAKEVAEASQRLEKLAEGAKSGAVAKITLSESRQQFEALKERESEVIARISSKQSVISRIGAEIDQLNSQMDQKLSEDLSKVTEQYRELLSEKKALQEHQGRIVIKAPVDGVVMNLPVSSKGVIIPPGGVVVEIVPSDQDLIMEVMVMPRDIGFVKTGQQAMVKLDSFDSARFGTVKGEVTRVAPTSTKMKDNPQPFYKVEITLANQYVGNASHQLVPGMTGEADIATGQKTVMQYLLKPVFITADTAFHER